MEHIQDLSYGKTCQERFQAIKERTSEPSLESLLESSSRTPLCLRFQRQDGHTQTVTVETDGALRTEFLTLNTGESPSEIDIQAMCYRLGRHNVAVESTLSSILEANAPEKYYLSAKACAGILRRAERRGKELPTMLREALEEVIALNASGDPKCGGTPGTVP